MRRTLQCCFAVESLINLLDAPVRVAGQPAAASLKVPTAERRDGESAQGAAARAFETAYGKVLGASANLWQPDWLPPLTHYRQLPSGGTEVRAWGMLRPHEVVAAYPRCHPREHRPTYPDAAMAQVQ